MAPTKQKANVDKLPISSVMKLPRLFLTGVAAGAIMVGGGLFYAGQYIYGHPVVAEWVMAKAQGKTEAKPEQDATLRHVPGTFYITIYNGKKTSEADEDHGPQTFKVTVDGTANYKGELVDVAYPQNKGLINGHWRGNALVFEYASQSEFRYGYGTFVLREDASASAGEASNYEGFGVVHQCQCKGKVMPFGPLEMVTAVLTSGPTVPRELAEKYLYAHEPVRVGEGYFAPVKLAESPKASSN